jgi:hypothetical protein
MTRSPKGSVSLQELSQTRRFKYRYSSRVFYLTLPRKGIMSRIEEDQIRRIIELDILQAVHDGSFHNYRMPNFAENYLYRQLSLEVRKFF